MVNHQLFLVKLGWVIHVDLTLKQHNPSSRLNENYYSHAILFIFVRNALVAFGRYFWFSWLFTIIGVPHFTIKKSSVEGFLS